MYIYTRIAYYYIFRVHVGGSAPVTKKGYKVNKYQRSILEKSFAIFPYINRSTLKELAMQTGLEEKQVSSWFNYKRQKTKREKCKETLY